MKEFALLFRSEGGDSMKERMSPQEFQAESQKWINWLNQLRESGKLTGGHPLDAEGRVVRDHGEVVSDGPFIEAKEFISEATELYRKEMKTIDLVLLDLAMPSMSGVEVFAELRRIHPDARVIFMTGYSRHEFGDLLTENAETTAVLSKPFPLQELKTSVESMLAR